MPLRTLWQVLVLSASSQSLVAQTSSAVSLIISPNPSVYGAPITMTATVTPSPATGRVTFYDGAALLGVSAVSSGQALFTTPLLRSGARSLHVHYSGDSTYSASDSAIFKQMVTPVPALSFHDQGGFYGGASVSCLAAADLNGDGIVDLVTCDSSSGTLDVQLGNRTTGFAWPIQYPGGDGVAYVVVGDLNGDGIPDLVSTSHSGIGILLGTGAGQSGAPNYATPVYYPLSAPGPVAIADFNDDGNADILVSTTAGLQVWLGKGDGTFTALPPFGPPAGGSMVLGDFNGDGKVDFAILNYQGTGVTILLGNGDGTFYQSANYAVTPSPVMMAAEDLNADGKLDLALVTGDSMVSILLGNGDGTFQPATKYPAGTESISITVEDMSGDGRPDLIVGDGLSTAIGVLIGNGDGSFQAPALFYNAFLSPAFIAAGDFTGAGMVGVAVASQGGEFGTIFDGEAAAPAALRAVSVSPASGSGTGQSFAFQFSDSGGITDVYTMSVMFSANPNSLANACVLTLTRSTGMLMLYTDAGTPGSSMPAVNGQPPGSLLQNSQCNVETQESSVSYSGTSQQLVITVGFKPAFAGPLTIRAKLNTVTGATTGWQAVGVWNVPSSTATPQATSVAPSSGTGTIQTFVLTYTDPNGPSDIDIVQAAIGTSTSAASSCVIAVSPSTGGFWVANDSGTAWGGIVGGGWGVNSQCTLYGGNSQVVWSGNTLTVTLLIEFASAYSGPKNIYASTTTLSGVTSSWAMLGTWTVGAPPGFLISTLAGVALPATSMPGTSAFFRSVGAIAADSFGSVYFLDGDLSMVFRLDSSGALTRVAGTGSAGYSGDNGPALNAQLNSPSGLAVDASGNLYISDSFNNRVRRVSTSGTITTVAGGGACQNQGDNGPATAACLTEPTGVAVDTAGNLFIGNSFRYIRKVGPSGIITTIAGTYNRGYSGDNGPATAAELNNPASLAVDASGNLFIADEFNQRIRKISPARIITTVAGSGMLGYSGDNGPATSAQLSYPSAITVDASGNLYIADAENSRLREVLADGMIATVVGTGENGFSGDGGSATTSWLNLPLGVTLDPSGNLYISDAGNGRIREVSGGTITTVAGGGSVLGPAAPFSAFSSPQSVVKDRFGNVYISDIVANCVYQITSAGAISTVAGTGVRGYAGDNGPATSAQLQSPMGLAVDSSGALYIADNGNNRIRRVWQGTITTFAGNGSPGYTGDGGPATSAQLEYPGGMAIDTSGDLFVADSVDSVIRKITLDGTITTVAGTGTPGFSRDNGPATSAQLNGPTGVAVDGSGNLYIADQVNQRIRKVTPGGVITTIAGTGVSGYSGYNGVAIAAELANPSAVAADNAGNVYIADTSNQLIRVVAPGGSISNIAGQWGISGPIGTGPALSEYLLAPIGLFADTAGNVYVSDMNNHSIRALTPNAGPAVLTISSTHTGSFPIGSIGQYTLTVSNVALAGGTNGTVTVTELLPGGLTLSSISGEGWSCSELTCTRGDLLTGGASYPPIIVGVDVTATVPSQVTNQVTVLGGGASIAGAQDVTPISTPIAIQTNPAGLKFTIDDLAVQTSPQTLDLAWGPHTIAVPTPQAGAPGTQYVFTGWSDSGAISHSIIVNNTADAYTASLKTQYQLTTLALPAIEGAVSPAAGSFFDSGSSVTLTATPAASYPFSFWSGGASGTTNPISITMNAATSVAANFFTCDVNYDGSTNVADVQLIVNEALGTAKPVDDLNHDGVVNVADAQKVINVVMGSACVY